MFYDVIIVGAGPAGAAAAYFLGQAGKKVLVLEKERLPRYKACGGGISLPFLQKTFPFSFDPVLESQVEALSYSLWGLTVTIPVQPGILVMSMRSDLDAQILKHARAEIRQGARVHKITESDEKVIVETKDGERFEATFLIGADGANSIVAHSLGLRQGKQLAAAIEIEVSVSPDLFDRFAGRPVLIFGELRLGYLWIFPKQKHLSVGIAAVRPKRGELQNKLRKVMARFGISLEDAEAHGHPIPLYSRRERIATARTLLVGDAAGLVDPFSGEGIRYAIKSGQIAAEALISGHPEYYPELIHREIGLNHIFARPVAYFFYHLQGLCLLLGAPNPFTTRAILDMLSDNIGTAEVMLQALITLPVFIVTEVVAAVIGLFKGKKSRERVRAAVYSNGR